MAIEQWEAVHKADAFSEETTMCPHCAQRMTVREEKLRSSLLRRLNCVEGQVRGIKRMVEKNEYCDVILNQIAAIRAALTSISKMVLENHIDCCLAATIRNGEEAVVYELVTTIGRLL